MEYDRTEKYSLSKVQGETNRAASAELSRRRKNVNQVRAELEARRAKEEESDGEV